MLNINLLIWLTALVVQWRADNNLVNFLTRQLPSLNKKVLYGYVKHAMNICPNLRNMLFLVHILMYNNIEQYTIHFVSEVRSTATFRPWQNKTDLVTFTWPSSPSFPELHYRRKLSPLPSLSRSIQGWYILGLPDSDLLHNDIISTNYANIKYSEAKCASIV